MKDDVIFTPLLPFELKDELFNGKLFDFRLYNSVLSDIKIKKMNSWGKKILGL